MGDLTPRINSLQDLEEYRHPVSAGSIRRNGLPMYGDRMLVAESANIRIPVTRLVARYEFRLDKSAVTGGTLTLKSLDVRNIPNIFHPAASGFRASSGQIAVSGDYSSASDVIAVNGGAGIVFYVPENMQGIESGLSDSRKKLPKNEDGAYSYTSVDTDCCTYIEARCNFNNGSDNGITYRMMLGENNTSSFNISRNTRYIVTLKPTGNPLSNRWWKCEPDNVEKALESVEISPSSQTLEVGNTTSFTATAHWDDGTETVVTNDPETSWTVISGIGYALPTSNKGEFEGRSAGTATIKVSYKGMTGIAKLTVKPKTDVYTYQLVVFAGAENSNWKATVSEGESCQYRAFLRTYVNGILNGSLTEEITGQCSWTSDDTSIATVNYSGIATGVSAGTTNIRATYDGYTDYGVIIVTSTEPIGPTVTHSLEITPATQDVLIGDTASFTAKYHTCTDGMDDGGVDVTEYATWTITGGSPYASATATKGEYKGKAAGTATVKAAFSDYDATATLRVEDAISYSLIVSPDPAEVTVGDDISFIAKLHKTTNGVKDNGTDVTSSCTWSVSKGDTYASTTSTAGQIHADAAGTATVCAVHDKASGFATLTVKETDDVITYELVVSPESKSVNVGDNASFTATYYTVTNGVRNNGEDVTTSATWSVVSGPATATATKGQFKATGAGTATIKAAYGNEEATGTIVISNDVTYELVVSPASRSVKVGEYASFTATYYTVTNGVRNGGVNVTSSATWSVASSNPVYAINKQSTPGLFKGEAQGSGIIKASYNGLTDTATVTVEAIPAYLTHVKVKYTVYDLVNGNQSASRMTIDSDWVAVPNSTGPNDLGNIASHHIAIEGSDGCSFKWEYTISYRLSTGSEGNALIKTNQPGGLEWEDKNYIIYTISNSAWSNSATIEFGPYNGQP